MKTRDELWDWVWRDGWDRPPAGKQKGPSEEVPGDRPPAPGTTVVLAPPDDGVVEVTGPPAEVVEGPPPVEPVASRVRPERARRGERRRLRRRLRLTAVAAMAGVAVAAALLVPRTTRSPGDRPGEPAVAPPPQSVVAWTVWDQRRPGSSFVAVLVSGGGLDPVALAIPGNAATSIPGHGLGTIDEAAATGDITTVAATIENVLGVQVDDGWGIPLAGLGDLVDEVGTVEVEGRALGGGEVVGYLREPGVDLATERAIRWQAVLTGLMEAPAPEDLDLPDAVRPAFASPGTEVLALPVEDLGAGLARPDEEAVAALVTERFVPTGGEAKVRLVVLNGNGEPGVGQEVARLLVPQGYRLVASQNASEFGVKVTKIIASARDDLPAARKAQRLLGVGRVLLGSQQSGVADVTVVVGVDFGGP